MPRQLEEAQRSCQLLLIFLPRDKVDSLDPTSAKLKLSHLNRTLLGHHKMVSNPLHPNLGFLAKEDLVQGGNQTSADHSLDSGKTTEPHLSLPKAFLVE